MVRYALGAKVLSSGRLAVGPSVDSWANGLVDTHHDVGLCGVLSHSREGPLDGVFDDANGCHGGYWRLFAGKQLGRHPLALAISPSKTWEGFWGGMACVAALVFILWSNLPSSYLHLDLGSLLALGLLTGGASVVGDLTVSALKREVGLKDSGSLLPGHGGLLDRLDSICGAAPVFALGLLLVGY